MRNHMEKYVVQQFHQVILERVALIGVQLIGVGLFYNCLKDLDVSERKPSTLTTLVPSAAEVKNSGMLFFSAKLNFWLVASFLTRAEVCEVTIYLIGDEYAGDFGAVLSHLAVPLFEVLISNLSGNVKHENGALGLEVVTWVKGVEIILACCVPQICG